MTRPSLSPSPTTPSVAPRWRLLDSLRGFAVFGILLVNVPDITRLGWDNGERGWALHDPIKATLDLAVQTRFVPIFIFLFGMGMFFVMSGARRRTGRAASVLVRRMVALGLIGAALMVVYPGNILTEYGIIGLVMVPIVLFSPRWLMLTLGLGLTVAAYALTGGGIGTTPGILLLGAAAAAYGLPAQLERAGRPTAIVFLGAVLLAIPAVAWQLVDTVGDPRYSLSGGVAGITLSVVYVSGLALLWRTGARKAIAVVFEPLGRMALTNYVVAAFVSFAIGHLLRFRELDTFAPALVLAVAIIAVQSLGSRLWLRSFTYGPIEWLWRCATNWRRASMKKTTAQLAF